MFWFREQDRMIQLNSFSLLQYYLTDQMIDSFTSNRKALKNINQQQNNSTLQNNFISVSKHSKPTPKQSTNKKILVKDSTDKKSKKKSLQNTCEKQDKHLKYLQPFQRTPQSTQRQEQNCQNYFLRKTIMALYKLFERLQFRWNLYQLNFSQLLKVLHQLGYIRFDGNQQINEKISSQLKKCYWIWMNISEGKHFNLCNLVIVLFCIEHLQYDEQLIKDIIKQLTKGIQKFDQDYGVEDQKYIFLVKNQRFTFSQGILRLSKTQVERLQAYLKDLRLNRLMDHHHIEIQKEPESNFSLLSKKSQQLAQTKRQKILQEIKQQQPYIQEIDLYHLLNYKTNRAKQRPIKTQSAFIKKDKNKEKDRKKDNKKANTNPTQYLMEEAKKGKNNNKAQKPTVKSKSIQKTHTKTDKLKQSLKMTDKTANKKANSFDSRQSIELQFDQFYSLQLKKINQKQHQAKHQIIDQLQWQEIPKVADQMNMQFQLFESKDDFNLCPPLSHTFSKIPQDKERKRKEYLDLPILFVDVNIEQGKKQRIVIYEGDKASELALDFGRKHKLTDEMINRLENLLQMQIGSVLTKIDESNQEDCSQLY